MAPKTGLTNILLKWKANNHSILVQFLQFILQK